MLKMLKLEIQYFSLINYNKSEKAKFFIKSCNLSCCYEELLGMQNMFNSY